MNMRKKKKRQLLMRRLRRGELWWDGRYVFFKIPVAVDRYFEPTAEETKAAENFFSGVAL